ncbi:MAG TPA: dioxygenase [Solirubrobacteraceae bacterium]|nr:dioxygenase [Solirubrobacteraceae bacterium]
MAVTGRMGEGASQRSEQLREDVVRAYARTEDPRLREILTAAVRHLHGFVSEVGLTTEEWQAGIEFLTAVGRMCSETRQEFILLSDTLGVSSATEIASADLAPRATENTVLGPFYVPGSPRREYGESILDDSDAGPRVVLSGRVTDLDGHGIAGATLDIWQNASNRLYAVQDPAQTPTNLRGRFLSRGDGGFALRTVRPVPYPIPDDGPVGRMLVAAGRHAWRPAHIHFMVSAPGYRTLVTHVFDSASDYLDSDTVFGVRDSLVVDFVPEGDDGLLAARFDIALQSE